MNSGVEKWIFASDVDRTLLTNDYRLPAQVRDAVQHARTHGIEIVLATARGPQALEIVLRDLGGVSAAIAFGGALTVVRDRGHWIDHPSSTGRTIDGLLRKRVIEAAISAGVSLALYTRTHVHVSALDERLGREFAHTGDRYKVGDLHRVEDDTYKFLAISGDNETERLDELAFRLEDELCCARSHKNYLEIGLPGTSKGAALEAYCRACGIERERVVAIGDSENDLPMLHFAGHSIAVGNATDDVKSDVKWITKSNSEGGVAWAIAKCAENLWGIPAPTLPAAN